MGHRLAGVGQMADRTRAFHWEDTPLGPPASWPVSLRSAASLVLESRFPMTMWWGPELRSIYNDAYIPVLAGKHPAALGCSAQHVWADIWHILEPQCRHVLDGGGATWNEHLLLPMQRKGFLEETYFTFSYSPLRDDDGRIAGVLVTCQETTAQVQGERQLQLLRDLAARTADRRSADDVCAMAASVLADNGADVPFALLYLLDEQGSLRQAGQAGFAAGRLVDAQTWPLDAADAAEAGMVVIDAPPALGLLPCGPWEQPPKQVAVVALKAGAGARPHGYLVAGLNPLREVDLAYTQLFRLAGDQIARALGSARAFEEERRRVEALAEIDRQKSAFFSNISHEFRTPLTLMIGPTEDALASPQRALVGDALEAVYRNEIRLLRLVNTLLDFARLEAGRMVATYEPTDLAQYTHDLASAFRSAFERAGLAFTVACDAIGQAVYVDHGMWEKVVLNLLSNALKFTFDGGVSVRLAEAEGQVVLTVADTGVGIAAEHVPHVFERFHRVEGTKARTHEGSGIGLALVHDLVRLHGGTCSLRSEPGVGTTVTVSLPIGHAHLAPERVRWAQGTADAARAAIGPSSSSANPFVLEASQWLPQAPADSLDNDTPATDQTTADAHEALPAHVLVVDDNADMRAYLVRLLSRYWSVHSAGDGIEALEAVAQRVPDLVLTDVMMPRLDGMGLLRALKGSPRTAGVPVVMLSARAGEEARIEGVEVGADDYLVKPFSARELMARIRAQLRLARAEQERAGLLARELQARQHAETANRAKDEFLAMLGHELRNPLAPIMTALQLMKLRGADAVERERAIIERQVRHVVTLVDDLLDVSRITGGKVELRRAHVELGEVVAKAIEMASPLLEQMRHELLVEVPRQGLGLLGDANRLAQVVSNILNNAGKYTEPGGLIQMHGTLEDGEVVLRVRDTGVGITSDMLPRVFDLFVQEGQTLARSRGGLGLGLTIAQSLTQLHGGSVLAESEGPGRGSTFTVRLPHAGAPAPAGRGVAPHRVQSSVATGPRVLVVDDNVDAAEMLAEVLKDMDCTVLAVHDGPAALEIADTFRPDVALLDIGLPVMDGYELARRLRRQPFLAGLRLVAITGYGQEQDRERSTEAGFHAHLVKPVDMRKLGDVLNRLVQERSPGALP